VIPGGESEQAGHAYIERVVVLDELFTTHGVHDRGFPFCREGDQFRVSSRAARAAKNGGFL